MVVQNSHQSTVTQALLPSQIHITYTEDIRNLPGRDFFKIGGQDLPAFASELCKTLFINLLFQNKVHLFRAVFSDPDFVISAPIISFCHIFFQDLRPLKFTYLQKQGRQLACKLESSLAHHFHQYKYTFTVDILSVR